MKGKIVNPLTPLRDSHLSSHLGITAESDSRLMRIEKMIANMKNS